jgi:hypothetical protein
MLSGHISGKAYDSFRATLKGLLSWGAPPAIGDQLPAGRRRPPSGLVRSEPLGRSISVGALWRNSLVSPEQAASDDLQEYSVPPGEAGPRARGPCAVPRQSRSRARSVTPGPRRDVGDDLHGHQLRLPLAVTYCHGIRVSTYGQFRIPSGTHR